MLPSRHRLVAFAASIFVVLTPLWVATPASADNSYAVRYYMQPVQYQTKVCTGATATYSMAVHSELSVETKRGTKTGNFTLGGVKVEAYPNDTALGSFDKRFHTTGNVDGGIDTAVFRFKAGDKPGKTTLVFQGSVSKGLGAEHSYGYVSFNIDIQIIECKFRVSGTVRFPPDLNFETIPAPALVAILTPVTLTVDADGRLKGSTIVHWVGGSVNRSIPGGVCKVTQKYGVDDLVNINGDLSDDGIITLHLEFPTALGNLTISCNDVAIPAGVFPYLIDLVTVQTRPSGGSLQIPTQYKDTKWRGKASIVVKKVTKQ